MDEFDIIRGYFTRDENAADVVIGIGDDGAELRPDPGRNLVTVVDSLVSGVHFPPDLPGADIGYRAVAVNLSDIAAMGARPRWMTLALTLPDVNTDWLADFASGMFAAADQHEVALVGGDTTAGCGPVITIQVTGDVTAGLSMTRSGAACGDDIYVTGTLGDAAAGLTLLRKGAASNPDADFLLQRFCRPTARINFGEAIAVHASAGIDVSDGLHADLEKLLAASSLAGTIDVASVPMSRSLNQAFSRDDAIAMALTGGDDYELCFTTAAPAEEVEKVAREFNVEVARIGVAARGSGLTCEDNGRVFLPKDSGYRHFA